MIYSMLSTREFSQIHGQNYVEMENVECKMQNVEWKMIFHEESNKKIWDSYTNNIRFKKQAFN